MTRRSGAVQVAQAAGGSQVYVVDRPAERLPAVCPRDIARAWEQAHDAARQEAGGPARLFRFAATAADEAPSDLVLADSDACCWAAAVDRVSGLATLYGLSLCLRLLALVELLGRARWMAGLFRLRPDGAELDAVLLAAAASCPLGREARFDEAAMRALLPAAAGAPLAASAKPALPGAPGVARPPPGRYQHEQAGAPRDRRGSLA